ncbi:arsenate reductase ArsC [Aurantiacibacter rhizosphaerae]|uniref:Arsenate reductase ArsC n=1 Tax=Aurantiacibacter rhizosphaerae TaxID=2691582 RepID=A0A844XFI5_9SPHN|nr:arsenate reductase ArsC [Aurantiacibacter rhizosphaerae]MWV28766.1 arsenate reductase ArsC [Aurantiacibacter rhizosphaerae]
MRNILFLCTANSARSILAEAILRDAGAGRFAAFSAGSTPRGVPNPLALQLLMAKGHSVEDMRSKSWDEFTTPHAPTIHAVITVCDNAKGESCPIFPGHPGQAHWGIPDPASVAADGTHIDGDLSGFETAYRRLSSRIDAMLALDEEAITQREWRDALTQIGRNAEGSTGNG